MSAHYQAGESVTLVADSGLVATVAGRVEALLGLVGREFSVLELIDALSEGSLATLPDFACVIGEGADLRLVLRGRFSATVGDQSWSGAGVATWIEQSVPGGAGAAVVVDDGSQAVGPQLPISSGVVWASQVTWQVDPATEADDADLDALAESTVDPDGEDGVLVAPDAPAATVAPVAAGETSAGLIAEPHSDLSEHTITEVELGEAAEHPELSESPDLPEAPASVQAPEPVQEPEAPTSPEAATPEVVEVESQLSVLDAMFGATVTGFVAEPREPEARRAEAEMGDHDGRTITAEQLRRLRAGSPSQVRQVSAAIVMADGTRHGVAPRLLIGRRPEARLVNSQGVPAMLTVDDPYVSSTHLDLTLDGERLLVTDLSTNGTVVILPGRAPQTLPKGEPTQVVAGTIFALSDSFRVTVELGDGR